ncbi:hypothetical protein Scep_030851 [Stephania cephalantha]|uniref:Uncharacterized protein n=1 Tax=Stephania cephalantha TaxID=152367 RepID=A0AAP0E386_9MAGN
MEDFEQNGADPLTVSVHQMNLDRLRFLFRSYLTICLQKFHSLSWTHMHVLQESNAPWRPSDC